MARLYTKLGFSELGLLGFRAAIEQGYFSVEQFEVDSGLDSIRSRPEFAEAMTSHEPAVGAPSRSSQMKVGRASSASMRRQRSSLVSQERVRASKQWELSHKRWTEGTKATGSPRRHEDERRRTKDRSRRAKRGWHRESGKLKAPRGSRGALSSPLSRCHSPAVRPATRPVCWSTQPRQPPCVFVRLRSFVLNPLSPSLFPCSSRIHEPASTRIPSPHRP